MFWVIGLGIFGYALYKQNVASTPCNCAPGYACNCPGGSAGGAASGIAASLAKLFSPAPAPVQPATTNVQSSGFSAVDSEFQPFSLYEAPAPPAGGGPPEPTAVSNQPANVSGQVGFGSARSVGGQIARIVYNPEYTPGAFGGPAYGRNAARLKSHTRRASQNENLPGPATGSDPSEPLHDGTWEGSAPSISAGGNGRGPNAPIGASRTGSGSWTVWGGGGGPVSHVAVTEVAPWIANQANHVDTKPLPGSSVHPAIPLANAPVNRAGGSNPKENIEIAHPAGSSATVRTFAAIHPPSPPRATNAKSNNVASTTAPPAAPVLKPRNVIQPRAIVSKPLPVFRATITPRVIGKR